MRAKCLSVLLTISLSLISSSVIMLTCTKSIAQTLDQLYQQAQAAQAEGNYPQAERIWRQILQQTPQVAAAQTSLGITLIAQGKELEAIFAFQRASRLNPNNTLNYELLGMLWLRLQRFSETEMAYRQLVTLKPNDPNVYKRLGDVFYMQEKWQDAVTAYRKVIQLQPDEAYAHVKLGDALSREGVYAAAIAAYRRGIQLNDRFFSAYTGLGFALQQQGELQAAKAAYQKALELDDDPDTREKLRQVEQMLQNNKSL